VPWDRSLDGSDPGAIWHRFRRQARSGSGHRSHPRGCSGRINAVGSPRLAARYAAPPQQHQRGRWHREESRRGRPSGRPIGRPGSHAHGPWLPMRTDPAPVEPGTGSGGSHPGAIGHHSRKKNRPRERSRSDPGSGHGSHEAQSQVPLGGRRQAPPVHEEVTNLMERLTYTVSEVAELLGISRSKAYELVADGLIPVVPLPGRRKLVARAALLRLLDTEQTTPPSPTATSHLGHRRDSPTPRLELEPPPPSRPPRPPARPAPSPPLHTVAPGVRGRPRGRPSDDEASG
jgi:excisionase family DNA binding protein